MKTPRISLAPFPDSWYRVAESADIEPGQIAPLHYFGRDLIAWRGEDGAVHVHDAFCAHLGANIAFGGFVEGNTIVCPFHHWRYDGSGQNVLIPYRDKPQRAAKLECWRTIERNGHLLVWYSDSGNGPEWEPPVIPEATDPAFMRIEAPDGFTISTHVQEIYENTVDIAHFQFVHGVSGFGAVELMTDGPRFRSIASVTMKTPRGEVQGAVESDLWGLGLDYVRQRGLGPGRTVFTATPVEENVVDARYTFFVERDEATGEPSRYGAGLIREFNRQISQDIPIWEHKMYRARPRLAMGEGAVVDFRRWAEQFYDEAAAAGDGAAA